MNFVITLEFSGRKKYNWKLYQCKVCAKLYVCLLEAIFTSLKYAWKKKKSENY